MRALPVGLVILLVVSCAGPQASPEVRKLVSLIKAERYDEAGAIDPDLMAPAFVVALREMKAEGADPKRIVAVADFFFDNYPFSVRDLAVDEPLFLEVAELHYGVMTRMVPERTECAEVRRQRTFEELRSVLSRFETHEDGGRCARHVYEIFRTATLDGFQIRLNPDYLTWGPEVDGDHDSLRELLESLPAPLGVSPWNVATAFSCARLYPRNNYQPRYTAWGRSGDRCFERWDRLVAMRMAWLSGLQVGEDLRFYWAETLVRSRFDSRLREIGLAMMVYEQIAWEKTEARLRALVFLIRSAHGTPLADRTRYESVAILIGEDRWAEAELLLRERIGQFEDPSWAARGLLYLTSQWDTDYYGDVGRTIPFASEALKLDPTGTSAISAWAILAEAHSKLERSAEIVESVRNAVALQLDPVGTACIIAGNVTAGVRSRVERRARIFECLEKALALPIDRSDSVEDNMARAYRSSAGYMLAWRYEKRKDWRRAMEAWKAWDSYHGGCGLHASNNVESQNAGIGRCLDALGHPAEAAVHYWKAVTCMGSNDLESTKRLRAIHLALGTDEELRSKIRAKIAWYSTPTSVDGNLKWLADELGVPVK